MAADPIWASVNTDGTFVSPKVRAAIDARTKATMRADLPALAEELNLGGAMPEGGEPGQVLTTGPDGTAAWAPAPKGEAGRGIKSIVSSTSDPTKATVTYTDNTTEVITLPTGAPGAAGKSIKSFGDPDGEGVSVVTFSDGTTATITLPIGNITQNLAWSKDAQAKVQGYWIVVSPTEPASGTYTTADGTVVPVIWQKPIERMVPVIPEAPYFDKYALSIQVASLVGVDYYLTGFTKDGATVDVPHVKIPDGGILKLADVSGKPALPYTANVEARAEPGYKLPNAFTWTYSVVDPNQVVLLTSDTFTGRDEGAVLRGTISDAKLGGTAKQWVKGWGPDGNEFRVSGGALVIGGGASRETVVLQGVGMNQRIEFDITANTLQKVNTAGNTFFSLGSTDGTSAGIHSLARLSLGGHYEGKHSRTVQWGVDGKLGMQRLPDVQDFLGHYVLEMFESSLIVTVPGMAPVTVSFTRDTKYAAWPAVSIEASTTHQLTVDNFKVSRIGF